MLDAMIGRLSRKPCSGWLISPGPRFRRLRVQNRGVSAIRPADKDVSPIILHVRDMRFLMDRMLVARTRRSGHGHAWAGLRWRGGGALRPCTLRSAPDARPCGGEGPRRGFGGARGASGGLGGLGGSGAGRLLLAILVCRPPRAAGSEVVIASSSSAPRPRDGPGTRDQRPARTSAKEVEGEARAAGRGLARASEASEG